ncbi:MAG: Ig-like domain-containing protein, partial [Promicromonosporaceae bacterium]|nr:Ig-like domain-containing protein [Promicromonosporaceae bacterium]
GSAVDNQALFAADGTPLASLDVFNLVHTGSIGPRTVDTVEQPRVTTSTTPVALPATIAVAYSDGTSEHVPVSWSGAAAWIHGPGTYNIQGTTTTGLSTTATVTVLPANALADPGFEDPEPSAWTATSTGGALGLGAWDDPHSGTHSAHFWLGTPFDFSMTQTVTGLPAGRYAATASLQGDGEDAASSVTITVSTSKGLTASAPFAMNGWRVWSSPSTAGVQVTPADAVTVTITGHLPAGAWGTIDDVALFRLPATTAPAAVTAALQAALGAAASVDRGALSASALAALDSAVAVGDVVTAAQWPTADDVARATALVRQALPRG